TKVTMATTEVTSMAHTDLESMATTELESMATTVAAEARVVHTTETITEVTPVAIIVATVCHTADATAEVAIGDVISDEGRS
ncbi:hypothetical protein, partial [Salmonella sp. s54496]|uniref:hypothetical protein n=1 Tax=Salmonella sp. s54496 TaxID=3159665 RepID=UPI0039813373